MCVEVDVAAEKFFQVLGAVGRNCVSQVTFANDILDRVQESIGLGPRTICRPMMILFAAESPAAMIPTS